MAAIASQICSRASLWGVWDPGAAKASSQSSAPSHTSAQSVSTVSPSDGGSS
jgi:hypothetical protein